MTNISAVVPFAKGCKARGRGLFTLGPAPLAEGGRLARGGSLSKRCGGSWSRGKALAPDSLAAHFPILSFSPDPVAG